MYELKFTATDDADWAALIDLTNDTSGEDYDEAADLEFTLEVTDCGSAVLSATTAGGTITRPADNQIQWRFTAAQMAGLDTRRTYKVGCVAEDDDGNITQIFVGELAVIDGGLA